MSEEKKLAFGLPMPDIISLYEARPERCAGGDGKGQFCRFVINSNLITTVMIDHFFDICDDAALASNVKIRGGTSGR